MPSASGHGRSLFWHFRVDQTSQNAFCFGAGLEVFQQQTAWALALRAGIGTVEIGNQFIQTLQIFVLLHM